VGSPTAVEFRLVVRLDIDDGRITNLIHVPLA
jgi:hypothetical protein